MASRSRLRFVSCLVSAVLVPVLALAQGDRPDRRGPPGGFDGGGRGSETRLDPEQLEFTDGVATIADRETFEKLSYQGPEVLIDRHLSGLQFVKFQIERADSDAPQMYFINTKTHRGHPMFMRAIGIGGGGRGGRGSSGSMRGVLVYRPLLRSPNGEPGLYTFEFEPNDSYAVELIRLARDLLVLKMPLLSGRLGYYPMPGAMARYRREKDQFESEKIPVYLEADLYADIGYLPLNTAVGLGRLRLMELDERPGPRDVVIYRSLPNEMPRVAGIITGARQTPLSHVNLRAIQDRVPNAFIADAWTNEAIAPLIGKLVRYSVAKDRFDLREATAEELESHFEALRPKESQSPPRDLAVTDPRPLAGISFTDSDSFGVKTANVAALRTFDLPEGSVPDGWGLPFSFYDAYMRHNGLYDVVRDLLEDPGFRDDHEQQVAGLARLRELVRQGDMPDEMREKIGALQRSFPAGTPLRCRSSTNNEDLPGFSGAGLYDSFTHHPDEGHLSKTIKEVFASLWNFRAFEERAFYRVDHFAAAMGVLVHPNHEGELANGVAVTSDVLYQTDGSYYLNVQVGEDLVTNPEEESIAEEVLLDWWEGDQDQLMRRSNRVADDARVLDAAQLDRIRKFLARIHSRFAKLYEKSRDDAGFAIEVEFKITSDGRLVVKQARPWVF